MFSISVCMIVKNEELVLDKILSCIKKFADEIIIVDTGSTDSTKDIAKNYTDNVYNFSWCNDFSKARNFSFSKGTKDYLMWLDADDYINNDEIEKIIKLKNSKAHLPSMFLFKYVIAFENNTPTFEFFRERLIRRKDNLKWNGFIHEVIPITNDAKYIDITIEHRKIKSSDPKRNLRIYREAKKKDIPFTPRDIYYYARELYYNNYYKSALKYLKIFLKCKNIYPPNEIEATILIGNIYTYLNNAKLAKKYLLKCLENHKPNSQLCCMLGSIFSEENKFDQAIFWYELALNIENNNNGFIEKDYSSFIPHLQLSVLYYNTQNYNKAKYHHSLAKSLKPSHQSIINNNKFFKK